MADRRQIIDEAPIVKTLRSLGAILLGKTNMHELGFGTTGVNTTWGTPVNPWGKDRYPGGSSSGSGAAVGAGLCPFSIGSDAGGSIRNPSSWNGCVGLLPTMGRVPEEGAISISPSLSRFGPIAGCVEDAMILYSLMADGNAPELNPINIPKLIPGPSPLKGLRIGVFWEWFNDASEEVVVGCKKAIESMQDMGAQVKPIRIPELDLCRVAHAITVSTEISSAVGPSLYSKSIRKKIDKDVMLNLKASMSMRSTEYVQAQRVRRRMALHWKRIMRDIDVVATPTTPTTAQKYSQTSLSGESSLRRTSEMMRFVLPANFLGLPAMAVPVGKDCEGLPISLQLIGKHCTEATLLRAAYHLETDLDKNSLGCKDPKICINLFKSAQ
ncbi:hypothetical protein BSKO_10420 [Bryopsis sp. KO-2023]|nr:hypothetical protein BSKO_10420 [Bryopsis sp. KO-2023]